MIARPIIFTDIDGVLNDAQYMADVYKRIEEKAMGGDVTRVRQPEEDIDEKKVMVLNELMNATQGGLVVHSSWRTFFPATRIEEFLRTRGLHGEVLGVTLSNGRFESIAKFVRDFDVKNFVILDDQAPNYAEVRMFEHGVIEKRFIHVEYGLDKDHVKMALTAMGFKA